MLRRIRNLALILTAQAMLAGPALSQEPPAPLDEGWKDAADLSYVVTAGNSETSTFGLKNKLSRRWGKSAFELNAGAVRVQSTTISRSVDPGPPASIVETSTESLTAENYALNGRYDRKITGHFFWYGGAGWDRNRFAGVQNRYTAGGGVGNIWRDDDRLKFRTGYALTVTKQEDVVENPDVDDTFLGARLTSDFLKKLGESTTFASTLTVDDNLDRTSDWRVDWTNSVAVTMSRRLALKASLQWLYDNEPSFFAVNDPTDALPPPGPTALASLEELDTIFTTSLVITF